MERSERILGGLWGAIAGDALGVPVEFEDRATVQSDPVTGMRGHGTHRQPAGSWSDDGSLILCTAESLLNHEFDPEDLGQRFVSWMYRGHWTPWGEPFDVGIATSDAIVSIANGARADSMGRRDEFSNGNGSLMRILPIVLRFAGEQTEVFVERIGRASAITHGHERSKMACVLYGLMIRQLLRDRDPLTALASARSEFEVLYKNSVEFKNFNSHLNDDFHSLPESKIASSGYVLHTLHASLWCLLTTDNLSACVLKAVNLGGDSDTTGCVAGGLAGVAYGKDSIPPDWIDHLARKSELDRLFDDFVGLCDESGQSSGSLV